MKYYKFALLKSYFDEGYGLTSFPKYALTAIGIGSTIITKSIITVIIGAVVYGIACFLIGLWSFKSGFREAQIEVSNKYNLFVKQMRKKIT